MANADSSESEVLPALSRFIAGLIGPVLLAIGVSMVINSKLAPEIAAELDHNVGLILFSGVLLLIAGIAIVLCHATWHGWPAIITGLGWLSIGSGLARILFPFQLVDAASFIRQPAVGFTAAFFCIALGGFLTAKAYR